MGNAYLRLESAMAADSADDDQEPRSEPAFAFRYSDWTLYNSDDDLVFPLPDPDAFAAADADSSSDEDADAE